MNGGVNRYGWHSDPGHAWLQVPVDHLAILGFRVAGDDERFPFEGRAISRFSYIDRDPFFAYLEEDCDAGAFVRAAEADGHAVALYEAHNVARGESPIRRMRSIASYRETLADAARHATRDRGVYS